MINKPETFHKASISSRTCHPPSPPLHGDALLVPRPRTAPTSRPTPVRRAASTEQETTKRTHLPHVTTAAGVSPLRVFLPSPCYLTFFRPCRLPDHSAQDVTTVITSSFTRHARHQTFTTRGTPAINVAPVDAIALSATGRVGKSTRGGASAAARREDPALFRLQLPRVKRRERSRGRVGVKSVGNVRQTEGGATQESSLRAQVPSSWRPEPKL